MDEKLFKPADSNADISAFASLEQNINASSIPAAEEQLELWLVRTIFIAKIITFIAIFVLLIISVYSWGKNQTQNSWLMSRSFMTSGTPLCNWVNDGHSTTDLRNDTEFRTFLAEQNQQTLINLVDNNRCMSLENLKEWYSLEKQFNLDELTQAYQSILPKKFLWITIDGSPELSIIGDHAPENRLKYQQILNIINQAMVDTNVGDSYVGCSQITFQQLSVRLTCTVQTRYPLQPRAQALEFINAISQSKDILVEYPAGLGISTNQETNILKTDFSFTMTYTPSRYEDNVLNKLSHES